MSAAEVPYEAAVSDPLAPAAAADDDVDVVVCAAPDAEESVAPADASAPAPLAAEAPAAPAPRIESDSSTDAEGGAPDAEPDLRALVTLLLARSDDNARRLGTAVYALSQRVDGLAAAVAAQARATASANHAPPPPRAPRSAVPAAASKGGGGSSKLSRGNLVIVLADSRAVQSSFASSATVAWQGAKDMSLLGKLGCVRQIDRSDGTIEVRFVDDTRRWFPPAALQGPLSLGDGMNVRELGPEPLGKGAIAAASAATASAAAAAAATSTRDTLASSQFPSAAPGMPSAGPGARTRPAAKQAPAQAQAKVRAKARAKPQAAPAAAKQAGGEQRQRVPSAGGKTGRRRGSAAGSDSDEDAAQSVLTRQKAAETDSWLQQQALLVAGPGQGPAQSRAERQRAQRAEVDRARIRTAEERAKREEIMERRAKEKMLRKVAFDRKEEEMRSRLREDQAKLRNRVSGATSMEHSTLAAERDRKRAAASKSRAIFQGLFGGDEGAEGEGSGADDGAEGGDAAKEEGGGDREEGAAGTGEGAATTKKTKAKKKKVSLFEGISEPASSLANASSSSSGGGGAGGGGGLFCDAPLEIPSAGEKVRTPRREQASTLDPLGDPLAGGKAKPKVEVGSVSAKATEDLLSGVVDERDPLFHGGGGGGGLSDLVPTALVDNVPTITTRRLNSKSVEAAPQPKAPPAPAIAADTDADATVDAGADGAAAETVGPAPTADDESIDDDPLALLGLRPAKVDSTWLRAEAKPSKKSAAAVSSSATGGVSDGTAAVGGEVGGEQVAKSAARTADEAKAKAKAKPKKKKKKNAAASLGLWGAAPEPAARSTSSLNTASASGAPVSYIMGGEELPSDEASEAAWARSASSANGGASAESSAGAAGAGGASGEALLADMSAEVKKGAQSAAALLGGLGSFISLPAATHPPAGTPHSGTPADEWARLFDDEGEPYYLHRATGETAWDLPANVSDALVLDFVDEPEPTAASQSMFGGLYAGLTGGGGSGGGGNDAQPAAGAAASGDTYSLYGGYGAMAGSFT